MSMPPRYVPFTRDPPTTREAWHSVRTRLTDYVAQVAQGFQSQTFRQIVVQGLPGTSGTIPFRIAVYTDGTPQAQLIADGLTLHFVPDVPGPGEWTMSVSASSTLVTFGAAVTRAWFSFFVAR